jgi:hypothetical protein
MMTRVQSYLTDGMCMGVLAVLERLPGVVGSGPGA